MHVDRQTDRHAHHNTMLHCRGRVMTSSVQKTTHSKMVLLVALN